jgi:hypothetical protein
MDAMNCRTTVGSSSGGVVGASRFAQGLSLLPRCYPAAVELKRLVPEFVENMEPALGLEPRTC